jgi:hypothetical protein
MYQILIEYPKKTTKNITKLKNNIQCIKQNEYFQLIDEKIFKDNKTNLENTKNIKITLIECNEKKKIILKDIKIPSQQYDKMLQKIYYNSMQ